jgi:hypothetical protein
MLTDSRQAHIVPGTSPYPVIISNTRHAFIFRNTNNT